VWQQAGWADKEVQGYEFEKDRYVLFDDEDFAGPRIES
jgi:non-homologous end joining protein Ku